MSLFKRLYIPGDTDIDWEMTPDYTFGTFESWGGRERLRNNNERFYYFFVDGWGDPPRLCLMERAVKHARVLAEILAPVDMVRRCVKEHGKVAHFERTFSINEEIREWLIAHVLDSDDDSCVVPIPEAGEEGPAPTGLPGRNGAESEVRVFLPEGREIGEADLAEAITRYNFPDQERNPDGAFPHVFVDNGDDLTVSDLTTGLMWQRGGLDIMSFRQMQKALDRLNREGFAGYHDWRLPGMEEAMSLLENSRQGEQYVHPCFSVKQPFVFANAPRRKGGYWFVDYRQGRAYWASGTIPGGFGRLCRVDEEIRNR